MENTNEDQKTLKEILDRMFENSFKELIQKWIVREKYGTFIELKQNETESKDIQR